jgi:SpoVK/Ycf46/Vps4 family AAA+-type ATPase
MWVGGTEQAIAQAFRQAEAEKAILLLDKADSLS